MTKQPQWPHKHLLGLEYLRGEDIVRVLDTAEQYREVATDPSKKADTLRGRTLVNFFLEASTRTRTSFGLAARRLGADVIDFSPSSSSVSKGETLKDTARTIEAMGIDFIVIRHSAAGAPHLLAQTVDAHVINAGDGPHEHPTQGLLDLFTIRRHKKRIEGLEIAIVGDIAHSRVARSNLWALTKLGAHVTFVGPSTLIPEQMRELGADICYDLDSILPKVDVINLLRVQFERQETNFFPSTREYASIFGITAERMALAKPDVLIMHPGPMNRGIEIMPDVADGPNSVILEQVANGVAVRMAVLSLLAGVNGK